MIDLGTFSLIFDIPSHLQYQIELKTEFSLSCGDSSVTFYSKYSKMIHNFTISEGRFPDFEQP